MTDAQMSQPVQVTCYGVGDDGSLNRLIQPVQLNDPQLKGETIVIKQRTC